MALTAQTAEALLATLQRIVDRESDLDQKDNSNYHSEEIADWKTLLTQARREQRQPSRTRPHGSQRHR